MSEPTTLGPSDVEVDHTHIDPIIHIYSNNDPLYAIKDIVKGLFLLHMRETKEIILADKKLDTNLPHIRKAIDEIKCQNERDMNAAEDYATKFIENMTHK